MKYQATENAGKTGGFSFGLSGLAGIIGGIVAYTSVPGFGLGSALVAGVGTWIGAVVGGIALGLGGLIGGAAVLGIAGLAVGALFRNPGTGAAAGATAGLVAGAIIGGVGGTAIGAVKGYEMTKDAIITKECKNEFNKAAYDCPVKTEIKRELQTDGSPRLSAAVKVSPNFAAKSGLKVSQAKKASPGIGLEDALKPGKLKPIKIPPRIAFLNG